QIQRSQRTIEHRQILGVIQQLGDAVMIAASVVVIVLERSDAREFQLGWLAHPVTICSQGLIRSHNQGTPQNNTAMMAAPAIPAATISAVNAPSNPLPYIVMPSLI